MGEAAQEGINVRAVSYFIALTRHRCEHCRLLTRVLALALPQHHQTLETDGDEGCDWQQAGANAFIFCVSYLGDVVRNRLHQQFPLFRPVAGENLVDLHWANHCEHCGGLLDEHALHCEPGGFMPISAAEASSIWLLQVNEAFEAVVAGYALEPEFFSALSPA